MRGLYKEQCIDMTASKRKQRNFVMDKAKKCITKFVILAKQKVYKKRLKYLYISNKNSDKLIVVFSGFSGKKKSVYNYVTTLKGCKDNKLFILDDFGWEGKGSYYLLENGNRYVEELVTRLIVETIEKGEINNLTTVGSSKGGSSALYYGLKFHADKVIAGAPQYYIGDYLNTDKHKMILSGILGSEVKQTDIDMLNSILSNRISEEAGCKTKVFLHYSKAEHTYTEHVKFMLEALEQYGYDVETDEKDYKNHVDVALHFPQFMKKILEL